MTYDEYIDFKLIEECAEVLKEAVKVSIFGDATHGYNNRELLCGELTDLLGVIAVITGRNPSHDGNIVSASSGRFIDAITYFLGRKADGHCDDVDLAELDHISKMAISYIGFVPDVSYKIAKLEHYYAYANKTSSCGD
jgi:hypothetical protein